MRFARSEALDASLETEAHWSIVPGGMLHKTNGFEEQRPTIDPREAAALQMTQPEPTEIVLSGSTPPPTPVATAKATIVAGAAPGAMPPAPPGMVYVPAPAPPGTVAVPAPPPGTVAVPAPAPPGTVAVPAVASAAAPGSPVLVPANAAVAGTPQKLQTQGNSTNSTNASAAAPTPLSFANPPEAKIPVEHIFFVLLGALILIFAPAVYVTVQGKNKKSAGEGGRGDAENAAADDTASTPLTEK